ncbi:hypothetical protein ASPWEDRAFT_36074 [Aspergillus wentii DTO 134E9]|uniref:Uncharacterized protein n=1 Tax=Aspergillus wentii DTO 134E9 TaxID=1073089 RepID=A0A1L9RU51_ASPWE|nr:uncharacterized protein ASPWEDRAFT_36074 [Aspergillus wentii DTO 134E9]OJJ38450.1 hypothetical protein ASPWEDRAFT_36074 [Aspergillus wentii DTO 134E9]
MSEKVSFGPSFIGMIVHFDQPRHWTWRLEAKVSEQHDQLSSWEFDAYERPSAAYGTFSCRNVNNPDQTGIMKIFKQVPYAGSDFEPPERRKSQASTELTEDAMDELKALRQLVDNGAEHTPTLRSCKIEKQGEDELVPDGFVAYLLIRPPPGRCLKSLYWALGAMERQAIRNAFRVAWLDCVKKGIYPQGGKIGHLMWDASLNKVYITEFQMWRPRRPTDTWKDIEWMAWGLAKPPRGYQWSRETRAHPDKTDWEM